MNKIKYVISIGLALFGLLTMASSFLGGLLLMSVGLVTIPPISEKFKDRYPFWKNKITRRATLGIITFLGIVVTGTQVAEKKENSNSKVEVVTKRANKPIKNKIRVMDLDKIYYDTNGKEITPNENDITYKVIEVLNNAKNKARESKNNWQILSVLIDTKYNDKKSIEAITNSIKQNYISFAPNNYVVEVWDSKKAYLKSIEREKYATQTFNKLMKEYRKTRVPYAEKLQKLKDNWDKKNYPFIAEHNLSILNKSDTQSKTFSYYPLVDDNYKKFGGKKIKKQH